MRPAAFALLYGTAGVAAVLTGACRAPAPCSGLACEVACPRDSVVDASGRCACRSGDLPVLGACLPPAVADAYCGRAGRASADGCTFVACATEEALDSDTGCVPIASLEHGGASACPPGTALVVASGRTACVAPDVVCPRGSGARGASCVRPPRCPAGTLGSGGACRPIVVRRHAGTPVVDVAAWASIVLGIDGGPGSPDLCRPLQAHPAAFGVDQGESLVVEVQVALTAPDEDITRVVSEVEVRARAQGRSLPPGAAPLVQAVVGSLLEPLRGLGGQVLATRTAGTFRCTITSL